MSQGQEAQADFGSIPLVFEDGDFFWPLPISTKLAPGEVIMRHAVEPYCSN